MSDIGVTYEELNSGADACTDCGTELQQRLDQLKSHLEAMGWTGVASDAFQGMFSEMHAQLVQVETQLGQVGGMLRQAATQYADQETGLASGFSGG